MSSSWAKTGFDLQKQARADQKEIEKAGEKVGLWGSAGTSVGALIGLVGGGLLGGKVGAGLGTALGGKLGGEIGKSFSKKEYRDTLKGEGDQVFYREDAKEMGKLITDDITKTSLGLGLEAGMSYEEPRTEEEFKARDDMKQQRQDFMNNLGDQLMNLIKKTKVNKDKEKPGLKTFGENEMMNTSYDSNLESDNPFK